MDSLAFLGAGNSNCLNATVEQSCHVTRVLMGTYESFSVTLSSLLDDGRAFGKSALKHCFRCEYGVKRSLCLCSCERGCGEYSRNLMVVLTSKRHCHLTTSMRPQPRLLHTFISYSSSDSVMLRLFRNDTPLTVGPVITSLHIFSEYISAAGTYRQRPPVHFSPFPSLPFPRLQRTPLFSFQAAIQCIQAFYTLLCGYTLTGNPLNLRYYIVLS